MEERIQKVMSQNGVCSRRSAEELIKKGRVSLNGRPVSLGDRMDPKKDILVVEGKRVYTRRDNEKLYYMLNKPRGVVTTLFDRHAKKNVGELIEGASARLFPVGRLDKDSEGLLLMTNDGHLANKIAHPSSGVSKSYRVSVKPAATEEQLSSLAAGVETEDGLMSPASVRVTGAQAGRTVFEITLREGKNREIRKMCETVGLAVIRLKRTSIGPLRLGALKSGEYRKLSRAEIAAIKSACGIRQAR